MNPKETNDRVVAKYLPILLAYRGDPVNVERILREALDTAMTDIIVYSYEQTLKTALKYAHLDNKPRPVL